MLPSLAHLCPECGVSEGETTGSAGRPHRSCQCPWESVRAEPFWTEEETENREPSQGPRWWGRLLHQHSLHVGSGQKSSRARLSCRLLSPVGGLLADASS